MSLAQHENQNLASNQRIDFRLNGVRIISPASQESAEEVPQSEFRWIV